jgi:DNA-binding MarR family transcriptional regulator
MATRTPFGFDAPEDSPGFMLWQTTVIWQRLIKKMLDDHGISHGQFVVMAVLLWFENHDQQLTQIDIAKGTKLDKMTVSKSLKKLASLGYVTRSESEQDTRAKWVRLTDQGKELVSQLIPRVEGIDEDFFKVLKVQETQELLKIFRKLIGE